MSFFSLIFAFPGLPNASLSLNGRLHFYQRSKLIKAERTYAYCLGFQHRVGWVAPEKAILSYEFYTTSRRTRDFENLIGSCKPWVDGLVDSGILVKDDCWHLEIGYVRVFLASKEETRLIISDKEV